VEHDDVRIVFRALQKRIGPEGPVHGRAFLAGGRDGWGDEALLFLADGMRIQSADRDGGPFDADPLQRLATGACSVTWATRSSRPFHAKQSMRTPSSGGSPATCATNDG
jgi:hypothetical protein